MNSQHTDTAKRRVIPFNTQQHTGGAIIDAQGREIPITEVMIQRACRELDRSLEQEQKQARAPASTTSKPGIRRAFFRLREAAP